MEKKILKPIETADLLGQVQMELVDLEVESTMERFGLNASEDQADYLGDKDVKSVFDGQR